MTNLEHLIENGLTAINKYQYPEWRQVMRKDPNYENNDSLTISIDDLWEICQYVRYTYLPSEIDRYSTINNKKGE